MPEEHVGYGAAYEFLRRKQLELDERKKKLKKLRKRVKKLTKTRK